jgi:hypothetical protein
MAESQDNRVGSVIVFREGITPQEAEAALEKIKDVIDPNYYVGGKPPVHKFDDRYGGPVWYIP